MFSKFKIQSEKIEFHTMLSPTAPVKQEIKGTNVKVVVRYSPVLSDSKIQSAWNLLMEQRLLETILVRFFQIRRGEGFHFMLTGTVYM